MKFPRELNALLQVSAVPDRHQQSRDGGSLRLGFLVHVSAHWPRRRSSTRSCPQAIINILGRKSATLY